MRRVRWITGPLLAAGIAAVLLLAPNPARAHTSLKATSPADSARLSEVPREIRLVFSGPVELAFTELQLIGPDGRPVALGEALHPGDSAAVIIARLRVLPAAGTYTVIWRTAAPDGHPLSGSFVFTVEAGAAGLPAGEPLGPARVPAEHHPPATTTTPGSFDAESPLYVAVRWLTFVGLLGLIGAAAFRVLVLGILRRQRVVPAEDFFEPAVRGAARLGLWMVALLAVAALLRLYAQSYALHGADDAFDLERILAMLTRTTWGWGWLLQAAATAVALVGLLWQARRHTAGWALVVLAALALAFAPALSGHAASVEDAAALAVLADGIHVLGAGGWLGSLLATVLVGLPVALRSGEGRGQTIAALVNAFSPTALFFAGTVVTTGILSAWLHLGAVTALWSTGYGQTLLVKLAVFSVVFATGAYNWLRVRPALGTDESARRLRRSSALELAVGVLVLAVTAVLVATPPPMEPGEAVSVTTDRAADASTGELVRGSNARDAGVVR